MLFRSLMGSQITLTISLVFIALFTVAILGFAIGFASDNNAAVSITQDPNVNSFRTEVTGNISAFASDSQGTYNSILGTTIEPGSDVAQSAGPFAVSITNLVGVGKNVINLPRKTIFGRSEGSNPFTIFFTTFAAIIVFLFGLYLYKTLRGNP